MILQKIWSQSFNEARNEKSSEKYDHKIEAQLLNLKKEEKVSIAAAYAQEAKHERGNPKDKSYRWVMLLQIEAFNGAEHVDLKKKEKVSIAAAS